MAIKGRDRIGVRDRMIVLACYCVGILLAIAAILRQSTTLLLASLIISWVGIQYLERPGTRKHKPQ